MRFNGEVPSSNKSLLLDGEAGGSSAAAGSSMGRLSAKYPDINGGFVVSSSASVKICPIGHGLT